MQNINDVGRLCEMKKKLKAAENYKEIFRIQKKVSNRPFM